MLLRSALLAVAVLCTLAPATASAGIPQGTVTFAKLAPLPGHTERGVVQLAVRPKASSISTGVVAGEDLTAFTFALSRRRCGYIGETEKNLFDAKPIDGFYIDDFVIGAVPPRKARGARSITLLGAGKDGTLEPRACGEARTAQRGRSRFKPKRKSVLVGLLLPFADRTERASLQVTLGPGPDSLALAGDFSRDGDVSYNLRLSSRSCARVKENPDKPGYLGGVMIGATAYSGTTFDDESVVSASKQNAHKAKSIVLVGSEAGGKFEPRACGYVIVLQDVLVSS